jgi:hypothetical protein
LENISSQNHKNHDLISSLSLIIMWGSKPLLIVSTAVRSVFTLQRLYTLPTVCVPHVARVCKALKHFRGECLGVHYEAFTKVCRRPTARDSYSSGADHNPPLVVSTLAKVATPKEPGYTPSTLSPCAPFG